MLHKVTDPLVLIDDVDPIDIVDRHGCRGHNVLGVSVDGEAIAGLLWDQLLQAGGMDHVLVCTVGRGVSRTAAAATDQASPDRAFRVRLISTGPKSAGLANHLCYMIE